MRHKDFLKHNAYWQVIAEKTGYDFSGYSTESLNRRLENFISNECIGSAEDLNDRLNSDKRSQEKILGSLMNSYTEMFRDPEFFLALRKNVLPYLSTYPVISIWHAGCASGEEVYSLAILLDELRLLDRCEIYATDISASNLKNAAAGIYPLQRMQEAATRYFRAGGKNNLSNYYTAYYDNVIFHKQLKDKIQFCEQDMIKEEPSGKFHLILCRNVFFYFDNSLQKKILTSFNNHLFNYGYLGTGMYEQPIEKENNDLIMIDRNNRIYRKVI